MLATILYTVILCTFGGSAFKMGNVRMQTKVTRYCKLDLVGPDGNVVDCSISNSMETMGLTLPGMDDGESLTTRLDVFITKDGQLTIGASPARPYEFIVEAQTTRHSFMLQLYNKTAFNITSSSPPEEARLHSFSNELTLEDQGWAHHGLVIMNNITLHKRVTKLHGTDPTTGMDYTTLAMTGLIPNSWTLYTNEDDTRVVKLLATNAFYGDKVFQETVVTHWEELDDNFTFNNSLELMFSDYDIEKHEDSAPDSHKGPRAEMYFIKSEITGERTREFVRDTNDIDWLPRNQLRGYKRKSNRIDYFRVEPETASYAFFHAKSGIYPHNGGTKFEYPADCMSNFTTSASSYCLYVDFDVNDTSLALDFAMQFQDLAQKENSAYLSISVYYSSAEVVLDFSFDAEGCATVWQAGVSFAKLNIVVCISGSGSGKSLLQPDNATYSGAAAISVSFNIFVPDFPTISVKLEAGFQVEGKPHNDVTASAYLELSTNLVFVGGAMQVTIDGNTVDNTINLWEFEAFFSLNVWVWAVVWSHSWTWTWPMFKAGPIKF